MMESLEEKFATGFFKKTSIDKLTWKNEIAEAHRYCRHNLQNKYILPIAIESLKSTVYLDIEGYRLKEQIDTIYTDTYDECQAYIDRQREKTNREYFYKNAYINSLQNQMEHKYWTTIFSKLTQLLGEKNLLLETERKIPYKQLGHISNEVYEE